MAAVCLGIAAYAILSPFLTFASGYTPRHKTLRILARLTLPTSSSLFFVLVLNILLPVTLLYVAACDSICHDTNTAKHCFGPTSNISEGISPLRTARLRRNGSHRHRHYQPR